MGLLSIIRKIKRKEKEIRLLILGLDNAGKTTILRRYCGESTDTVEPTLGFRIQTLEYRRGDGDGPVYQLHLWDVGGQRSIRAYWRNYFEQTDGLIWVVDSTDRHRIDLCRQELAQLLSQERLAGASLLVLANKQDVDGALSVEDIIQALDIEQNEKYQNRHWSIRSCSAVTGQGLHASMEWLVEDIRSRIFMLD